MPELPEVETTCRGIAPTIIGCTISQVIIRETRLRWGIAETFAAQLTGQTIQAVQRRAKYIVIATQAGHVLIHLGMSGSLRLVTHHIVASKHDHVDIAFDNVTLRFNDPRRFGAMLWTSEPLTEHRLLKSLGVEPLDDAFTGDALYHMAQGRRVAIKTFIMNAHVVVGVGNIYANEALFAANILPTRLAYQLTLAECERLALQIRLILQRAIDQGGTTLRDFVNAQGRAGYFQQQLNVYGRANQPCINCQQRLIEQRLAHRSTVYCANCQQ